MYKKEDIQDISYDLQKGLMVVKLNKKVLHKNYLKDTIYYKVSYDVFIEKVNNYLKIN